MLVVFYMLELEVIYYTLGQVEMRNNLFYFWKDNLVITLFYVPYMFFSC